MKVINPANGQVIKNINEDTHESVQEKYASAYKSQPQWASVDLAQRLQCIKKFQSLLREKIQDLSKTLTLEVGKPLKQSTAEIRTAIDRISFFLEHSEKWLGEEVMTDEDGLTEKIRYEPLGVIANISAWNYPYLVGLNVFIPALIAGNAVLYKPSEYAAMTGLKIQELLHHSGVPESIFQTVIGGRDMGEILLELPLDGYFFTGSYRTGKYISKRVASKMVPCQLELGGKDPMYITDDNANIKEVAALAAEGAFYNNGQSCCAVDRLYVHQAVYDDFISAFLDIVRSYKIGDPMEDGVFIGPLTRKPQLDFLDDQVKDALDNGAKVLTGGGPMEGDGYYFEPTVLVDTDHNMKVMMEESFGPLIGIQKVKDDEEAIHLMKDTAYGLTSSVVTDNEPRADKILRQMNSGTVYWNCCDRLSPKLPWSGRGHSGIGSTLSYQGIRAFVQPKSYHLRKK